MITVYERHTLTAILILDLEDAYARSRGRPDNHPRPLEPLRFFLTKREINGVVKEFNPPLELEVNRNPSGYHLFYGRQKIYNGGGAISLGNTTNTRTLDLPDGKYTLRVTSALYQTIEKTFDLPIGNANDPNVISNYRLDLEASIAYPFPDVTPIGQVDAGGCNNTNFSTRRGATLLRGGLLNAGGVGIAGASVRVVNRSNTYVTDTNGEWVLWFKEPQPSGPVNVNIEIAGQPVQVVNNVCVVHGYETSLHQTALRGWVLRDSKPAVGAVITVQGKSGQAASGKDGGWTFAFPFSQGAQTLQVNATVTGMPPQGRMVSLVERATINVEPFKF